MFFIVKLTLAEGREESLYYASVDQCLHDRGLQALFSGEQITACTIYKDNKRIAGLGIMTWKKFKEQLISSAPALLRE
jgi:hypothetical protein